MALEVSLAGKRMSLRRKSSSLTLHHGEVVVLRGLPSTATLKDVQDCLGSLRPVSIDFHEDESGKFKGRQTQSL